MLSYFYTTRKNIALLVIVSLCAPAMVFAHDHAHTHHNEQESIGSRKAVELRLVEKHKKAKQQLASQLLKSKPNVFDTVWSKNSIISGFEKRELQLNDVIDKCNRSVTAFGSTGLEQLLIPVSDYTEIHRRQIMIQSLVQDEALFNKLRASLSKIAEGEDALLTYWDAANPLKNALESKSFYYWLLPGSNKFNESSLALEGRFWWIMFASTESLLTQLCLTSVITDFLDSNKKNVDFWGSFKNGLERISTTNNPVSGIDTDALKNQNLNFKEWTQHLFGGTAGDKYQVVSKLVFGDNNFITSGLGKIFGFAYAAGFTILYDATWLWTIGETGRELKDKVQVVRELQKNLVRVASLMRALDGLEKVITKSPLLVEVQTAKYLQQVMNKNKWSDKLKQLMDLLNAFSFNKAGKKIFSAGQVLCAHKLLTEVKDELVPALQAVAEFDAYCSLAQLYKESLDKENCFTFAEFVENDTPQIKIDACWEPLVSDRQAVVNDIRFGADGKAIRMMITGPNGCGKSTFLKSLGHAVIMAQSWGIVPAKKAQLTMFTGVRTSLDPKEDILNGISTFMAQRMRIGQVQDFVHASRMTHKTLVMLDEPYRGTTDYLTEECIFDFGKEVARLPNVVVCIATHVKKPVELARNGSFVNYHVEIEERENDEFKRLFTIAPGAADKWLNDRQWMKRFVYWLDRDMQRSAMKKVVL